MLSAAEVGAIYDQGKEAMVRGYLRVQEQIIQLMGRVSELERQLNQNSQNSSKPPSSEGYKKPAPKSLRKKTGRKKGGQPGHPGKTLERVAVADHVVEHWPMCCGCCGELLREDHALGCETRQVHDIPPIKIETTDHQAMPVVRAQYAGGISTTSALAGAIWQRGNGVGSLCDDVSVVADRANL